MYILREIAQKLNTHGAVKVTLDEPMSKHFSFKIGGKTPLFVEPENTDALLYTVNLFLENSVPFFILGGGTNIVFGDNGFNGAVVSTACMTGIEDTGTVLKCCCGTQINSIVNYACKKGLSGIQQFSGLPGTVGGACYMNARCFELEMSDVTLAVEYLQKTVSTDCGMQRYERRREVFSKDRWTYKVSPFTGTDCIITSVEIKVNQAPDELRAGLKEKANSYFKARVDKGHFKYPCAGSVFKNNHAFGKPSGVIIDECGLKGLSLGGAQVAPWHGNIIINTGNATASDVKGLVNQVRDKVKELTGFDLECEILFYGE